MAEGIAIVLSGGGSKGAFQVGVLDALSKANIRGDIFVGVSTGAIQALAGALDSIPELVKYWEDINNNDDIFRRFSMDPKARRDASPLRKKISAFYKTNRPKESGKLLRIGVASLQSGAFCTVDETVPDLDKWVYASCAVPIEYEPFEHTALGGAKTQWVDGGVREVTPLAAAAALDPRATLMIRASPAPVVSVENDLFDNLIEIGLRAVDILQSEVSTNDMANLALHGSFLRAISHARHSLLDAKVPPAVIDDALKELEAVRIKHAITPVLAIAPAENFSKPYEFNKVDIARAIVAGRQTVEARLPEIKAFLDAHGALKAAS